MPINMTIFKSPE